MKLFDWQNEKVRSLYGILILVKVSMHWHNIKYLFYAYTTKTRQVYILKKCGILIIHPMEHISFDIGVEWNFDRVFKNKYFLDFQV
jgi:hypothetical protein